MMSVSPMKEPEKYDKDVVRDHIKKTVDDPYSMTDFSDVVTPELTHQTASVYKLFFNTFDKPTCWTTD